jgi:N-acetylated-alpha-linked acidic dipeptidase
MVVESNWNRKPIYDVIAKLPGSGDAGQWVMRGNHHDGWVFGAWDPLAGTVALMGEAKAMGALYRQGWRPRRTIIYTSWDGEEPGLLGSTEWAETHAGELRKKAVLYVNSDTNARGFLRVGGTHSLQHMVNQVGAGVIDPETHVSVLRRLRARILVEAAHRQGSARWKALAKAAAGDADLPISTLGSGSDFTPFLDHLGIASLSVGFGGEADDDGVYHSRYDSFDHFTRFGDPTFAYEVALAKVAGHIVMRIADAKVLPMRFTDFGNILGQYVEQLHKKLQDQRDAFAQQQKLFTAHAYRLSTDPVHPLAPPASLPDVPEIDLAPLDQAAKQLQRSAQACAQAYRTRVAQGLAIAPSQLRRINDLIGTMHQRLLSINGLPTRPWYRNELVAPGIFTGYGVKVFPAIEQALQARQWNAATRNVSVVAHTLDGYRKQLDELTASLKQ